MKTFKDFLGPITEIVGIAPKAKGEHKFVHSTYLAQTKDPGDLEKVGPEEVGPKDTKSGQGKRPADRLDNKQKFAEAHDDNEDDMEKEHSKKEEEKERMITGKKKSLKSFKESLRVDEADLTPQQTKMAHTIGKEFEKKKVGDPSKGGPYAVATAMVKDKPEAAKKAYATIKSKMKEDVDSELLIKLYDDLNEDNQQIFMSQLEEDADALLVFAKHLLGE